MTDKKEMARLIVEEVCRRINSGVESQSGLSVLALFCGGLRGAEEAITSLNACRKFSTVRVVLTPSAEKVIGKTMLEGELAPEEILTDASGRTELELIEKADLLVIPVLTRNTAAKIACGIADNLATNLVMQALLRSKPVIAVRDGCDVGRDGSVNPVYKARLTGNIRQLEQYGIVFTSAAGLGEELKRMFRQSGASVSPKDCEGGSAPVFSGKILTRADVTVWPGEVLSLQSNTLVTPSARDAAAERGIELRKLSIQADVV